MTNQASKDQLKSKLGDIYSATTACNLQACMDKYDTTLENIEIITTTDIADLCGKKAVMIKTGYKKYTIAVVK